jgi:hypothetical protein
MDPKPDKECEKHSYIALVSEIIASSIYWQVTSPTIEIPRQYPAYPASIPLKPRPILKHTPHIRPVPRRL